MLIFTRRRNQTIMIGDGIEVRVLRVGRDGVRLGICSATRNRGAPAGNLQPDPRRESLRCGDAAPHGGHRPAPPTA